MTLIVRIAQLTQPNLSTKAQAVGRAQLLTIPYSHFNEVAKFSLKVAGVPFEELAYPPIAHVLPTLATRLPASGERHVPAAPNGGKGNPTLLPLCAMPDGTMLVDSWAIVDYVSEVKPELGRLPESLRRLLNEQLGPLSRQALYALILKDTNYSIWTGLIMHKTGWRWRGVWRVLGRRFTERFKTMFKASDPLAVAECRSKLRQLRVSPDRG